MEWLVGFCVIGLGDCLSGFIWEGLYVFVRCSELNG